MLRFITGLDVTLCQYHPPPHTHPPTHTPPPASSLPPSHSLLFSLFHSFFLSVTSSLALRFPSSPLSLSLLCAPLLRRRRWRAGGQPGGVKQGPVCSQALLVPASSYLLVSRAAVALLCVTAQPCLFSPTGSCLSWLWTSFKTCPVSAPSSNTHGE